MMNMHALCVVLVANFYFRLGSVLRAFADKKRRKKERIVSIEPETFRSIVHGAMFVPNRSSDQKPIIVLFIPYP